MLALWFGTTNGRLPEELDGWIARPGDRHATRRNGSILSVEAAGDFTLTLQERPAEPVLTPREREVLGLVARGLTKPADRTPALGGAVDRSQAPRAGVSEARRPR